MKNRIFENNKTKLIAFLLLICTAALMFSSCAENKIDKPEDTNLEYWLLDRPNKNEWTELSNSHWLDDKYYLASGYEPIIDENGNLSKPEKYVMYTVGDYPLHDFGVKRIISIDITDPDVMVWGLTINSSKDKVISILTKNGFVSHHDSEEMFIAQNGNYKVCVKYSYKIEITYDMSSIIEQILIWGYGK